MLAVFHASSRMAALKESPTPPQCTPHLRREMIDRVFGGEAVLALLFEPAKTRIVGPFFTDWSN
jgi:hypothetical protein